MANGIMASEYTQTYTSFSGCDIVCTFGGVVIGELQAITYSISREKAPVYTMGSPEPRSFSRGKRGIAGTIVFTVFDRDSLLSALEDYAASQFVQIGGNLNETALTIDDWDAQMQSVMQSGSNPAATANSAATITTNGAQAATPIYDDQIPPFDITIKQAIEV